MFDPKLMVTLFFLAACGSDDVGRDSGGDSGCEPLEWYPDEDGDGYGDSSAAWSACEGDAPGVLVAGDCDDENAERYPGAPEICDGLQNDCDASGWSEDGLATFVSVDGVSSDHTSAMAGLAESPNMVMLSESGTLALCNGVWYANTTVSADVEFVGHGDAVALNGGGVGTVVRGLDGVTMSLSNLTIEEGYADTVDDKQATAARVGGGVRCGSSGTVSLASVSLRGNTADNGGGIYASGGCVVTLSDVVLTENTAENGGGLYTHGAGRVVLGNVAFTGNTVSSIGGAARVIESEQLDIEASSFTANTAATAGGLSVFATPVYVAGTTFSANTSASKSGALYISDTTNATVSESVFTENETVRAGGGVVIDNSSVTMSGLLFSGNVSSEDGGGFHTSNSQIVVTESEFRGNSVADNGGAVNLYNSAAAEFVDVTFIDNSAVFGGAISLTADATVSVEDSDFTSNAPSDAYTGNTGNTFDYGTGASFTCDSSNCSQP